jgi:hypothetical protein
MEGDSHARYLDEGLVGCVGTGKGDNIEVWGQCVLRSEGDRVV